MAILSGVKIINNTVWEVTISIQAGSLSQSDSQLISKFGEPVINTGFTYTNSGLSYTLPNNYVRVVSDLPFVQQFDSSTAPFNQGFTNTQTQVNAFITNFETVYAAAFATLRSNVDTWSGQFLFTV